MSKANEPAYPHHVVSTDSLGYATSKEHEGLTKREKLAMEIYSRTILSEQVVKTFLTETNEEVGNEIFLEIAARSSLRAADIFFEQLEKNK